MAGTADPAAEACSAAPAAEAGESAAEAGSADPAAEADSAVGGSAADADPGTEAEKSHFSSRASELIVTRFDKHESIPDLSYQLLIPLNMQASR